MDTQVNESLNNTFSWIAPKNKVYCGSQSLGNRLSIAIGINALGMQVYFERLFKRLGIIMTSNVLHYLTVKETSRSKKHTKSKLTEVKKKRKASYFDKTKAERGGSKAGKRAKRDGKYKTGQNMQDESSDDDAAAAARPATRRNNNTVCPLCGKKGHTTNRSRKCTHYRGNAAVAAGAPPPLVAGMEAVRDREDAADMDLMDSLPLIDDQPSDISLSCLLLDQGMFDEDAADDHGTGTL